MHKPGYYRDAFSQAVDAFEAWETNAPEPVVDFKDSPTPISRVFGLCWNCDDIMPASLVTQVQNLESYHDPLKRRTYAAASRLLLPRVKDGV